MSELLSLLKAIDRGEKKVEIVEAPDFCNYPKYKCDGWTIVVFDDCGDFDYVEYVITPDGKKREYEEIAEEIGWFRPTNDEVWGYPKQPSPLGE